VAPVNSIGHCKRQLLRALGAALPKPPSAPRDPSRAPSWPSPECPSSTSLQGDGYKTQLSLAIRGHRPLSRPLGGIGIKRSQVDHPLPSGEGRGEGTALHVESCCGRGYSTLVTSPSGSVEASPSPPSPSPGGRGVTRFEDLCPRITNGHLDTRLTRSMPMVGWGGVAGSDLPKGWRR
jgi:hypothetical protein